MTETKASPPGLFGSYLSLWLALCSFVGDGRTRNERRVNDTDKRRYDMTGWQNEPFAVDVKAGDTKAFCLCGLSGNGPFCDGSHKTTDKLPHMETFDRDKTVYICGCQRSGNRPFCDGTHKS